VLDHDQRLKPHDVLDELRSPASLTRLEESSFQPGWIAQNGPDRAINLLRMLPSTSSDLIVVYDSQAQLIYASPAVERILGFRSTAEVDQNILDMVHPDDQERCVANLMRALSNPGVNPPAVYRVRTSSSGAWRSLEVIATNCLVDPSINGVVLNLRDVTHTVEVSRAYATFGRTNQMLLHATSEDELLQQTCETIIEVGGYAEAWIGVADEGEQRRVTPVASAGRVAHLEDAVISWADDPQGQGPVGRALRSNQPHTVRDLLASGAPVGSRAILEDAGLRACCALPINCGDGVRRVLVIADSEVRDFEEEELQLFLELADNLALGLRELRSADALVRSEARFRTLAASSPIGILETNAEGSVTYANERMAEIAGTLPRALLGRGWIDFIEPEDRILSLGELKNWDGEGVKAWQCRIRTPKGAIRHVQGRVAAKAHEGFVVTVTDVTDEVRAQDELTRLALVDPLTGLPNRTQFLLELRKHLRRGRRANDGLTILFLDLDHLKLINDSLGHDAGDAVICEAAARFRSTLRADELVARFGGDEFIFLIQGGIEGISAVAAAERLLETLNSPFDVRGVRLSVSCSIGVAIARRDDSAESLVRDADTAMYRAKEQGRGRIVLFDDELRNRTVARLAIESDLGNALERGQLELRYQPIVDLSTAQTVGAEALLRWRHPERGVVQPLEFIHVAEDLGLISEIGAWVMQEGARQLARWDDDASTAPLRFLAVNVSSRQLEFGDPRNWVVPAISQAGIDMSRIEIEVTESVAINDLTVCQEALLSLRELGLTIALDDFGTGYSSLSCLHSLPITTVKIDRSFIERLLSADSTLPIVRAILEMSHAMGLQVVAEGVSSEEILAEVASLGCDLAQGFHFARPMTPEDFSTWSGTSSNAMDSSELRS
jgi:diguanylate cyclase (GGDEF)-like protein/PAS domain S-box-containing protein